MIFKTNPLSKAKAALAKAASRIKTATVKAARPFRAATAKVASPLASMAGRVAQKLRLPDACRYLDDKLKIRRACRAVRGKLAQARPYLLVCSCAVFLGLFITLLEPGRFSTVAIIIVGLTALVGAVVVLWAGMHGKSWAISLSFLLLAFTIDTTFRRRADMASSGMDAQTIFKLMLWGGGFFIGACHFRHIKAALMQSSALRWLLAFAVWCFFSTVYSITPTYTFGGGFGYLALLLFVAVVMQTVGPDKIMIPAIYACGLITTSAIVLYKVAPGMAVAMLENGSTPRLAGFTGSPNNLGRIAAIALFFIFFAVRNKQVKLWRWDILAVALSALACLVLSWSRTSLAGLIVAIGLVLLRKRIMLLLWSVVAASSTLLMMVMANVDWDRLVSHISRNGSLSELTTLTGRTAIWHYVWSAVLKQPLIGYGYGSTKLLISQGFRTIFGWTTTSAHNMFLQALVTTGAIGAVCVVAVVLLQLRDFFKRPHDMADAAFLFVLISGFSEAGAVGVAPNLLTILWLVSLTLPRQKKEEPTPKHSPQPQRVYPLRAPFLPRRPEPRGV